MLKQWLTKHNNSRDRGALFQDFRTIIGSIISLGEPLVRESLGSLLDILPATIALRLRPSHSVLNLRPYKCCIYLFVKLLLSQNLRGQTYRIDGPATHQFLSGSCLWVSSSPGGLRENICELGYPEQTRQETRQATIERHISDTSLKGIPVLGLSCST